MLIRKKITFAPGLLFSIYLIFNGLERYIIESIRVNDKYSILGYNLSQAQIIAVCLIILGIILSITSFLLAYKKQKNRLVL